MTQENWPRCQSLQASLPCTPPAPVHEVAPDTSHPSTFTPLPASPETPNYRLQTEEKETKAPSRPQQTALATHQHSPHPLRLLLPRLKPRSQRMDAHPPKAQHVPHPT